MLIPLLPPPRHFDGMLPAASPTVRSHCELLGLVSSLAETTTKLCTWCFGEATCEDPPYANGLSLFLSLCLSKRHRPRLFAHLVLDPQVLLDHWLLGPSLSVISSMPGPYSMPQYCFSCLGGPYLSWLDPFLIFLHLHESQLGLSASLVGLWPQKEQQRQSSLTLYLHTEVSLHLPRNLILCSVFDSFQVSDSLRHVWGLSTVWEWLSTLNEWNSMSAHLGHGLHK